MGALGRDLRVLTERAYKIESIQAFDMFPRTKHIETPDHSAQAII